MIFTGYFAQVHKYVEANLLVLSIANRCPQGMDIFKIPWLALGEWIYTWKQKGNQIGISQNQLINEYIKKYTDDKLRHLSPEIVFERLYKLVHNNDAILLCYEKLPEGYDKDIVELGDLEVGKTFCHRHIVSAFLRSGGFECREYLVRKQQDRGGLF